MRKLYFVSFLGWLGIAPAWSAEHAVVLECLGGDVISSDNKPENTIEKNVRRRYEVYQSHIVEGAEFSEPTSLMLCEKTPTSLLFATRCGFDLRAFWMDWQVITTDTDAKAFFARYKPLMTSDVPPAAAFEQVQIDRIGLDLRYDYRSVTRFSDGRQQYINQHYVAHCHQVRPKL